MFSHTRKGGQAGRGGHNHCQCSHMREWRLHLDLYAAGYGWVSIPRVGMLAITVRLEHMM